jgi:predicted nuclease of predicted toxin-antitoxin system
VRFLVDAQLPPRLVRWIVEQGETAEHLADLDLLHAGDGEIWRVAAERGCVILSKDEDFAVRSQLRSELVQVVWVRTGNIRNDALLARFEHHWPRIREALESGEPLVEMA